MVLVILTPLKIYWCNQHHVSIDLCSYIHVRIYQEYFWQPFVHVKQPWINSRILIALHMLRESCICINYFTACNICLWIIKGELEMTPIFTLFRQIIPDSRFLLFTNLNIYIYIYIYSTFDIIVLARYICGGFVIGRTSKFGCSQISKSESMCICRNGVPIRIGRSTSDACEVKGRQILKSCTLTGNIPSTNNWNTTKRSG